MPDKHDLSDRPASVALSPAECLAKGYRDYERYCVTLTGSDGSRHKQTRDMLRGGRVVSVLPVDLARDEIVLIRQFRLPAHLSDGRGEMIEIVAGRVEPGETADVAAHRECREEIGVAPMRLIELFSYLTTPGLTDEEVTLYLASIDATGIPPHVGNAAEDECIETVTVSIDAALSALAQGGMRNGQMLIALQWLALNRARLGDLLKG